MRMRLDNPMRIYACSMGKVFRVTHVCLSDEEANEECRKDASVGAIAMDQNGLVYLAELYGSIAPSAIMDDMKREPIPQTKAGNTFREAKKLREESDGKPSPFRYPMGAKVKVTLSQQQYVGEIITRQQSHTGGINYAVWADYKHTKGSEWFMESQIEGVAQ